jgi:tRNA (guanine-N7-)-methyltransferase
MPKRNKLMKFAEILSYPHVFENYDPKQPKILGKDGEEVDLKGKWAETVFKNNHPLTLELACGRGEYSLGLAKLNPDKNYIGIDIKGARIWEGATKSKQENLNNVAFFRTRIEQTPLFFQADEISEIWIVYPDPFLRESKENRRLTSPNFLSRYRQFLRPGSYLHLKTDSEELYEYTLQTFEEDKGIQIEFSTQDLSQREDSIPEHRISTYYERMHLALGKKIKYIKSKID